MRPTASLPRPLRQGARQLVLLAALMAGAMAVYAWLLRAPVERVWSTRTFLDDGVPFWPAWTWVYLLPYGLAPVLAVLLPAPAFSALCRRALVAIALGFLAFFLLPTEVLRPDASGLGDGLTARLYRAMIAFDDPPRNAAPSLHVALSILFGAALGAGEPRGARGGWALLGGIAFALLVSLSTLFTGQHHVLDVLLGGVLAALVLLGPRALNRLRDPRSGPRPEPASPRAPAA